jgi:peptidoglycan hydrolase-like protein with peptidoglycan-binding domain
VDENEIIACGKYTRKGLQQKLADLGYYHGPIDGQPSAGFLAAMAQFLSDNGLTLDASEDEFCAALDKASKAAALKTGLVIGAVSLCVVGAGVGIWLLARRKK